jgi:3',5'-cyclic AMP phosphodiesterase CpdA
MPVRLVHISDIHVTATPLEWQREDWFNKRLPGWINFKLLGRGWRFRHGDSVLATLVAHVQERKPDRIIFSGDATAMGFESEFARAADILKLSHPDTPPGLAVPGNHDYYTPASAARGHFERHFAPWLQGEREGEHTYPFAQRVGSVWIVAVNSCTGNRWMWDAGGTVDEGQLDRLARLLASLEPGPRILVTHYPVALASGKPERRSHALRNLADLVRVAHAGGIGLWLHGHRHGAYFLSGAGVAPFPVVCVGSSTQSGHWSFNEYAIDGTNVAATRLTYSPEAGAFRESERFSLELPTRAP